MNIGIDMGGTHTGVGLVEGLEIKDKIEFATDVSKGPEHYAEILKENIDILLRANSLTLDEIKSIGMGVPGSANRETGMVEYANNLGFENVEFEDILTKTLGRSVLLDNDANLAALGEYLLTESRAKSFIMVTIGTGIGCGFILNGEVYRGVNFAEGEIGHMTIKYDGVACNCGRRGCFEAYASAGALVKLACDAMVENPKSYLWRLKKIDGKGIFEAVRAKDKTTLSVLDEYTTYLSVGLTNIINIFQPEELAIGGGISVQAPLFMPDTLEKISKSIYSKDSKKNTIIKAARFANDAGIIGAALQK